MVKIEILEQKVKALAAEIEEIKNYSWKEGEWLISKSTKTIARYSKDNIAFGIWQSPRGPVWNMYSHWTYNSTPSIWRRATENEIRDALIKEAINRGFKEGVRFTPIPGTEHIGQKFSNSLVVRYSFRYIISSDSLDCFGTNYIYRQGKWATVINKDNLVLNDLYEPKWCDKCGHNTLQKTHIVSWDKDVIYFGGAALTEEVINKIKFIL